MLNGKIINLDRSVPTSKDNEQDVDGGDDDSPSSSTDKDGDDFTNNIVVARSLVLLV
jgi:hypothetical protein